MRPDKSGRFGGFVRLTRNFPAHALLEMQVFCVYITLCAISYHYELLAEDRPTYFKLVLPHCELQSSSSTDPAAEVAFLLFFTFRNLILTETSERPPGDTLSEHLNATCRSFS